ncbi:amidohydrolase family protein [Gordonia sp. TBRC 11910]|uniref:Amidohydrolase family protein n=1 Tax=Gordonia asplenii TaxID=2725283 RepID=A0A848KWL7_9ACTN|nr:amidohydrolase family protein [Gordonia asplenii]NMO02699.1 amidohydrolase family protein [Gordonia asplenii]
MQPLEGVVPGVVDAHAHFWNPKRTPWASNRLSRSYRFLPRRVGDLVFTAAVGQADREFALTPRNVARAYEPAQYELDVRVVQTAVGVPIESVVFVESHWHADDHSGVDEARYVASLPFGRDGAPDLGAFVAHADPRHPNVTAQLDLTAAAVPQFRGVRMMGARHPDPKVRDWVDVDAVLSSRDFLAGFARIAERDLLFEAFVYSHQLYDVVTLAREYPQTTIVIDHLGAPVGVFGPVGSRTGATAAARSDVLRLWRERTAMLAQNPNVVMKLSGLAFPILGYGRLASGNIGSRVTLEEMIAPLIDHLLAHFGVDRLLFGSNYPIDKPNAPFETIVVALAEILKPHGEELLRKVFRENARRVYRM